MRNAAAAIHGAVRLQHTHTACTHTGAVAPSATARCTYAPLPPTPAEGAGNGSHHPLLPFNQLQSRSSPLAPPPQQNTKHWENAYSGYMPEGGGTPHCGGGFHVHGGGGPSRTPPLSTPLSCVRAELRPIASSPSAKTRGASVKGLLPRHVTDKRRTAPPSRAPTVPLPQLTLHPLLQWSVFLST